MIKKLTSVEKSGRPARIATLAGLALCVTWSATSVHAAAEQRLSVEVYQDKIYAFWLGQMVGNIYGLPHENQYIDTPGEERFPYGYVETKRMRDANGAFSDDDTDIEYIYLHAMEKHGPEPTYAQLAEYWKRHIRQRVWVANRAALAAMNHGFTPPVTGLETYNPHWFQIDPQLVNEIWAATAPGMVRYAAQKSDWGARIMSESWGSEPTIHYGAMFAAAFLESDVEKLIDIGTQALPQDSRFAQIVEHMKRLHRQYPNDWKAARAAMSQAYYVKEPAKTKTIWNAALNAAAGILALLYGEGDFQKTLDLACAMGFDADNQAATMAGLIAVAKGSAGIPQNLLFPLPELKWTEPFNNTYKNLSRHGLPDARLTDLAARTTRLGEKIILQHGGKKIVEGGKAYYVINSQARFVAPLELPQGPLPVIVVGEPLEHIFPVSGAQSKVQWRIVRGTLPPGLSFAGGKLKGQATKPGVYPVTLQVTQNGKSARRDLQLLVRGQNLAADAAQILASVAKVSDGAQAYNGLSPGLLARNVEVIRDGRRYGEGSSFYSLTEKTEPRQDFYGYSWSTPQRIGLVSFHTGAMDWVTGWFSSLRVEYQDTAGNWQPVKTFTSHPAFPQGNKPDATDRPHFAEYVLSFEPIETTAVRIIGDVGHIGGRGGYTAITELAVYPPLPESARSLLTSLSAASSGSAPHAGDEG